MILNLSQAKLKPHNYYQVVLSEEIINDYLIVFFQSLLGSLLLRSIKSETLNQHLTRNDLLELRIPIPSLEEQKEIISAQKDLAELKNQIIEFEALLEKNPMLSMSITTQITKMLESIKVLSDSERIKRLAVEGESKYIEFKETLSLNVRTKNKDKNIEESALKTVVAFLNSGGGTLIIGISDDGIIPGVDKEIEKFYPSNDKYLLHWKNLVKERIGEEFYPFIESDLRKIDKIHVLEVVCKPSKSPCFLDKTTFYVRTNPATDKLEGIKLADYLRNHFG